VLNVPLPPYIPRQTHSAKKGNLGLRKTGPFYPREGGRSKGLKNNLRYPPPPRARCARAPPPPPPGGARADPPVWVSFSPPLYQLSLLSIPASTDP